MCRERVRGHGYQCERERSCRRRGRGAERGCARSRMTETGRSAARAFVSESEPAQARAEQVHVMQSCGKTLTFSPVTCAKSAPDTRNASEAPASQRGG